MEHSFIVDKDGNNMIVAEKEVWPYCQYIECKFCKEWFCDGGCDDLDAECPMRQWALF